MRRYLLDTSALLALRDNEAGANQVADLLRQARTGTARCFACFMTLMELYYRVWKDEGEIEGNLAYEQCQSLPITWVHENQALLEKAAELKATHPISLADAWIAACSILQGATLVHKDPEFETLEFPQLVLPYKN
jgi:predicted nucleic acid-binding protein